MVNMNNNNGTSIIIESWWFSIIVNFNNHQEWTISHQEKIND